MNFWHLFWKQYWDTEPTIWNFCRSLIYLTGVFPCYVWKFLLSFSIPMFDGIYLHILCYWYTMQLCILWYVFQSTLCVRNISIKTTMIWRLTVFFPKQSFSFVLSDRNFSDDIFDSSIKAGKKVSDVSCSGIIVIISNLRKRLRKKKPRSFQNLYFLNSSWKDTILLNASIFFFYRETYKRWCKVQRQNNVIWSAVALCPSLRASGTGEGFVCLHSNFDPGTSRNSQIKWEIAINYQLFYVW